MDILPEKRFYVYISDMTSKLVNFPNFIMVAYASSAPTCIIHARDDELHMLTDECSLLSNATNLF